MFLIITCFYNIEEKGGAAFFARACSFDYLGGGGTIMAEAGAPLKEQAAKELQQKTEALQKLKKQLSCPKCRKFFTQHAQPKLLACLHSVCASCLVIRDGVRKGLKYIVACPECGEETELPKTGVSSLPTAYFKVHLTEAYIKLERAEEKRGAACEECAIPGATVDAFCSDCNGFICQGCVEKHQMMKVLTGHKIEPFETYKRTLQAEVLSSHPVAQTGLSCPKHGELLKMYCKTCHMLICKDCTVLDHLQPRHKYDFVQRLISSQKSELQQGLAAVNEIHSTVTVALGEANSATEMLSKQRDDVYATISASFTALIEKLERCKEKVLTSAKEEVTTKLKELGKHVEKLETRANELEDLIHVCEQSLNHTTDQEFMTLKRHMMAHVKEVSAKRQQYAVELVNLPSMFLPVSCTEEITQTILAHAEEYHSLSTSKTTVHGSGTKRAEVGKEAQFTIHTRYPSGRACIEKNDISVKVSLSRSDTIVKSSVTPGVELGTYEVSYLPEERGQYEVSIEVDRKAIEGTPLHVTARPSKLDCTSPLKIISNQEWAWGVACSSTREVYITKNYHHTISVLDKDGRQIRTVGIKGQKPGHLWSPTGIAVNGEGLIYVADGAENGRLQKLNRNGQLEAVFGQLSHPQGVLLSQRNDKVYVCDKGNQRIVILDKNLKLQKTFGELSRPSGDFHELIGTLLAPHSVAEDSAGNIYVTDTDMGFIQVFSENGEHLRSINNPYSEMFAPTGICIEDDLLFVSDCCDNHQVVVFRTNGEFVTSYGSFGKLDGQFHRPLSLALDVDGYLYVCDYNNGRIQVF